MNLEEQFAKVKILVIGDVMLDRYWWGSVKRISPEAPVPVVCLKNETLVAGGAANVAANVKGLGAEVFLVGVLGVDSESGLLIKTLNGLNISTENLVKVPHRLTTLKTRIIVQHQQVARIDQEATDNLNEADEERVWQQVVGLLDLIQVVIISDYAKGLLSDKLLSRLITTIIKKEIPLLIDPKGKDYRKYRNATMLTPNRKEALEACNFDEHDSEMVVKAGTQLVADLNLEAILITEGEHGMTLFEKLKKPQHLNALARHVFDVTGAGDTVIATLGVALGAGANFQRASEIANSAAGLVVEEVGTTVIKINKLQGLF